MIGKKVVFLYLLLTAVSAPLWAQQAPVRKGAIETATISIPTIQNELGKDQIERYLTREDGIQTVKVDYKKKTVRVTYLWDRTTIENIKTAIANVGYDADDVTADPEAYRRLPTACKKPEDRKDKN